MHNMNLRFDQMINAAGLNGGVNGSNSLSSAQNSQKAFSSVNNDSSFLIALENARKRLESENQNPAESPKVQDLQRTEKVEPKSDSVAKSERSETVSSSEKVEEIAENEVLSEAQGTEDFDFSVEELLEIVNQGKEKTELADDKNAILDIEKIYTSQAELQEEKNSVENEKLSDTELLYAILSGKTSVKAEDVEEKNEISEEISLSEKDLQLSDEEMAYLSLISDQGSNAVQENDLPLQQTQLASENADVILDKNNSAEIKLQSNSKNPVISVVDERTSFENGSGEVRTVDNFVTKIEQTSEGEVEMSMNLAPQNQNSIVFEGTTNAGAPLQQGDSNRFTSLLSQQLQSSSADFVKAGNLVLKDGGKGTINLVMHPEELGNVKIQLELTDKLISGKIIVATKEAFEAFSQNMNNLKNAFAQSGFEGMNFDLSWSGQEEQKQNNPERNFYANVYEENVPDFLDSSEQHYEGILARDALMYGSSMLNIIA